ncbi:hypothetical protein [Synechococcus sp. PCC 6312]|uniref:hypothetical protein n=1 Tax=Synechococcus sp. (strain ATCC 27167 / PCC 6312) TaxID=195253 RepID=UPI0012E9E2A9|nr:hypothetical protein [Synechococcus sp. PCC 6312]
MGPDKNNLFFVYAPGQASDFDREAWERRKQEREAAQAQQRLEAMPVAERDRLYRKLPGHGQLTQRHHQELSKRRITPEMLDFAVKQGWLQTWNRGTKVNFPCDNLPGVLNGKTLGADGIAIAALSPNGHISGYQISPDNKSYGKYKWLSSASKGGPGPQLSNGNLPLAIWRHPDHSGPVKIILTEGFLKSLLTALQYWFERGETNVVVIGTASSGLFKGLREVLTEFEVEGITLCPDSGSLWNNNLLKNYRDAKEQCRNYNFNLAWWGQVTKGDGDIDEIRTETTIEYLTWEQFKALSRKRSGENWLQAIVKKLETKLSRKQQAQSLKQKLGDPPAPDFDLEYQEGQRPQAWQQAVKSDYKYILDVSGTGTSKSHTAGQCHPDDFDANQLFYISNQHRNVTTETLENWADLEARHNGLIWEKTPNNDKRLRRAKDGEIPNIPANCNRTELISSLRSKNVDGADTAALICGSCPLSGACRNAEGPNFGYLHQRRVTLARKRLRAHPDGLPNPMDYDFPKSVLIWDEPGESFTIKNDIKVDENDVKAILMELIDHPEILMKIQPILSILGSYLSGNQKTGYFGLEDAEVRKLFENIEITPGLIEKLEQVLAPDLRFLNEIAEGVEISDLPQFLRKKFTPKDSVGADQIDKCVIKQWLSQFLRILVGCELGAFSINRKILTISTLDDRHRQVVQTAQSTIFLDATLTREDLALKLGISPDEIYVIRQAPKPTPNLKITQIADLGRMGMQRGQEQMRRLAALISHYRAQDATTKLIDFKKFSGEGDGAWWRDSRGSNDFLNVKTLVLVGPPCRNLNDLAAEFKVMTGHCDIESDEFKDFVNRQIRADYIQALGRLRANRRPNEHLEIVIISDFDLAIPVEVKRAWDVCPDAGTKTEKFLAAINAAIEQLKENGQRITQRAVQRITNIPRSSLNILWKMAQTAISGPNSSLGPSEEEKDIAQATAQVLEQVAKTAPHSLLETLKEIFLSKNRWLAPPKWGLVFEQLTYFAQKEIVAALLLGGTR